MSANFDKKVLTEIWGAMPREPLTGQWNQLDAHHILGRNAGDKTMSSPYNFYPLPRAIHSNGFRDHRYFRAMLLEIAEERVNEAIRDGRYEETDNDAKFLKYRNEWLSSNL